jgi:hypothetical protein
MNGRYLREADIADPGLGRRKWAESRPSGVAQGTAGIGRRPGRSAFRVPPHHCSKRPYAKRSISACASAISSISGVGEKPSSAGARTAWASPKRPVD